MVDHNNGALRRPSRTCLHVCRALRLLFLRLGINNSRYIVDALLGAISRWPSALLPMMAASAQSTLTVGAQLACRAPTQNAPGPFPGQSKFADELYGVLARKDEWKLQPITPPDRATRHR